MSSASHDQVLFGALFHHIVLPPKLPANPESDSVPLSWELTERFIAACNHLRSPDAQLPWKTVEASLRLSQSLLPPISKETLAVAFSAIADGDGSEYLAFHVAQQNAAVILYKNKQTDEVIFEAFEVSASTRAVLDTNNALRCVFPCRAVAIPVGELAVPSFRDAVADSPTAVDYNIYDRAYEQAIKDKLKENPSARPIMYLTKFVKETDYFKSFENITEGTIFSPTVVREQMRETREQLYSHFTSPSTTKLASLVAKFGLSDPPHDARPTELNTDGALVAPEAQQPNVADDEATLTTAAEAPAPKDGDATAAPDNVPAEEQHAAKAREPGHQPALKHLVEALRAKTAASFSAEQKA
ncbi:hypothetical protein NLG97_g2725 [Lecanicillium saksenae]|uniref:Uncharacterized protein n=1 Tax=Lecanicillium saksenae TaxID=468837 RepID=A0ACC1R033_9HYPO|nr:hypothetical protein NLG97_g2725 [Lecanicillium saksenae]